MRSPMDGFVVVLPPEEPLSTISPEMATLAGVALARMALIGMESIRRRFEEDEGPEDQD